MLIIDFSVEPRDFIDGCEGVLGALIPPPRESADILGADGALIAVVLGIVIPASFGVAPPILEPPIFPMCILSMELTPVPTLPRIGCGIPPVDIDGDRPAIL